MKLNWNTIISNAITVLVATVFVGAGTYLWHGVQTVDQRIDRNLSSIRATQDVIAPKVDNLEQAIGELLSHHRQLCRDINSSVPDETPIFDFKKQPTIDLIDQRQMEQQAISVGPR